MTEKYIILKEETTQELAQKIAEAMEKGYVCQGGISHIYKKNEGYPHHWSMSDGWYYMQGMILADDGITNEL
jgi:hypothetical protein